MTVNNLPMNCPGRVEETTTALDSRVKSDDHLALISRELAAAIAARVNSEKNLAIRSQELAAAIVERKAFTVGIPDQEHVRQADYLGIASGRDTDKIAVARLTPVRSELVDAPYIAEFPLTLECRLIHTADLGMHTLFVGEVVDVKIDEAALTPEGDADIRKINPFLFDPGARGYYGVGEFLGDSFSVGRHIPGSPSACKQD